MGAPKAHQTPSKGQPLEICGGYCGRGNDHTWGSPACMFWRALLCLFSVDWLKRTSAGNHCFTLRWMVSCKLFIVVISWQSSQHCGRFARNRPVLLALSLQPSIAPVWSPWRWTPLVLGHIWKLVLFNLSKGGKHEWWINPTWTLLCPFCKENGTLSVRKNIGSVSQCHHLFMENAVSSSLAKVKYGNNHTCLKRSSSHLAKSSKKTPNCLGWLPTLYSVIPEICMH